MKQVETLIVGAGPTGLGAAWACERDGRGYLLVEGSGNTGGLARTIAAEGYRWDLGGHVIHSHFPDFDEAIRASAVRMIDVRRTGRVLFGANEFVPVPLQQQLDRIPEDIQPGEHAEHLAQYFRHEMGAALCESFFYPFNTKMWAHPLTGIDHAWTSYRSGSQTTNVPRVGLRKIATQIETFPYPHDGSGSVWDGIAARLDPSRRTFGVQLVALDLEQHIASFDSLPDIKYERLVSSIPLDQLCRIAGDDECRQLGAQLVHTQVTALGFGFAGPIPETLADKTYIYAAAGDLPWYRATLLSNYSSAMAPEGCWNILFECSSSSFTAAVAIETASAACLKSLAGLGVDIGSLNQQWSHFLEYGYPVPVLGRDALLRRILKPFEKSHVHSRGRFGGWRYESCNQDYSFAQGVEAAASGGSDVLWHPERF